MKRLTVGVRSPLIVEDLLLENRTSEIRLVMVMVMVSSIQHP